MNEKLGLARSTVLLFYAANESLLFCGIKLISLHFCIAEASKETMDNTNQVLASRWKRLGGSLLDSFILLGIVFTVAFATGAFNHMDQRGNFSLGYQVFMFILGLIAYLAVNGFLLAKYGQTVGKKVIGTRIVDFESGEILSVWKVFCMRLLPVHLLCQLPVAGVFVGLADVVLIFRNNKRCLHDLIAETKVVDVRQDLILNEQYESV